MTLAVAAVTTSAASPTDVWSADDVVVDGMTNRAGFESM
jgi:hypothetical protein